MTSTVENLRYQAPFRKILRFRFLAFLFLSILTACQSGPRFTVETLPRYEAVFQRASGWTGGDGAYSAALGNDRFLWLFGDSLIGEVKDGKRVQARLVSNSIAVQTGKDPETASVDFFYHPLADRTPAAFVRPEDGRGWFWPGHGTRTQKGLFLFFMQVERTGASGPFGFRPVSGWLGHVGNPDEPPDRWVVSLRQVPWASEYRHFGMTVLIKEEYGYIYGVAVDQATQPAKNHLILARAPVDRLDDFDSWRFFAEGEWTADVNHASRVCENVASEFSVSYQSTMNRFILVETEGGLSPNIAIRHSPTIHGPWSGPIRIYRCPEARRDPRVFCYAAKGHPEIAASPEELIVTYVANSTDFALIQSDATLYRPRFLRIRFFPAEKE